MILNTNLFLSQENEAQFVIEIPTPATLSYLVINGLARHSSATINLQFLRSSSHKQLDRWLRDSLPYPFARDDGYVHGRYDGALIVTRRWRLLCRQRQLLKLYADPEPKGEAAFRASHKPRLVAARCMFVSHSCMER